MTDEADLLNRLEVMGYTDIRYRTRAGIYSYFCIRRGGRGTTSVRGAGNSRTEALTVAYERAVEGRAELMATRVMHPKPRRGKDVFWSWVEGVA